MSSTIAAAADERRDTERRLVRLVGAVVFVDTMFYSVVAPLLPTLSHDLRLSKLSAGVLTAGYAAGTLVGSIPGGILAARIGPRQTVCLGLALLVVSTLAFGVLNTAWGLDASRFVEGLGGACSWAGGVAWIVAQTSPGRRGAVIGQALSAAIAGSLLGPAIGALASAVGRPALFTGVAVLGLWLIDRTRRLGSPGETSGQGLRALGAALRQPRIGVGLWLMGLPALAAGLINLLGPLRMHRFGAGAGIIGLTFLLGAGIEALVAPFIGRISDRRGRFVPLQGGLAATAVLLACFVLPHQVWVLAAVIVLVCSALGTFWAPAMAMLSDAADRQGLDQGLAAALMNLAWAGGQVLGSAGGGGLARVAGDWLPLLLAAAVCLGTLAVVLPAVRRGA